VNAVSGRTPLRQSDSFRSGQTPSSILSIYKGFKGFPVYGADRSPRAGATERQRNAGFTLVELSVVLVVIAILAAVAVHKLWSLQADAERSALENMVGGLRSALGMNVASYIAKADLRGAQVLAGSNPMDLLAESPRNYRGALDGKPIAAVEDGEWYFDRKRAELAYRVRNADMFRGGSGPPAEARFAVKPVYEDHNRNGRFDAGEIFYGVRLEATAPYRWVRE
jgi:prepilin-type N-terminal cleavage/methylation domain-containing protein